MIERRYKKLRWAQHILFVLALAVCIIPMVVSSIKVIPAATDTESRLAFGCVAVFFITITILVLFRNVLRKFVANIPCTFGVLIVMVAIAIFLFLLKKIIDDALAIVFIGAVGSFFGVVLETISTVCKIKADDIKTNYSDNLNAEKEGDEDV